MDHDSKFPAIYFPVNPKFECFRVGVSVSRLCEKWYAHHGLLSGQRSPEIDTSAA